MTRPRAGFLRQEQGFEGRTEEAGPRVREAKPVAESLSAHKRHKTCTAAGFVLCAGRSHVKPAGEPRAGVAKMRSGREALFVTTNELIAKQGCVTVPRQ